MAAPATASMPAAKAVRIGTSFARMYVTISSGNSAIQRLHAASAIPRTPLKMAGFGRRMGERFTKKATNRGKVYVGIGLRTQWESDGFAESDGFEARLQEVSPDRSHEEDFLQNPSQPVTLPEPVTTPTCDDGCGAACP